MAKQIALLTDTTCDLLPEMVSKYNIIVLPHYVIWGEEQFMDRVSIQPVAFYERLVKDPVYPSSAHATVQDYAAAFAGCKLAGADEIVAVTISSAMSGAMGAAMKATEQMDIPVHIVDAKGPSMSVGWQVLAAARVREAGGSSSEMVAAAERVRGKLAQVVCMDSLEYLYKGGRIGNAARLVGTLLNVKPVVHIDHDTGLVEPAGVARTHKRAVEMLVEKFYALLGKFEHARVAVLHGNVPEEAGESGRARGAGTEPG